MLKQMIEGMPKLVEFSEQADKEKAAKDKIMNFSMPENSMVDDESYELTQKILEFMEDEKKKGINLTFTQALQSYLRRK